MTVETALSDADYWQAVAEIDCIYYELEVMLRTERRLSAFAREIDKATGYDQAKLKLAKQFVRRARFLQKKIGYDPDALRALDALRGEEERG